MVCYVLVIVGYDGLGVVGFRYKSSIAMSGCVNLNEIDTGSGNSRMHELSLIHDR